MPGRGVGDALTSTKAYKRHANRLVERRVKLVGESQAEAKQHVFDKGVDWTNF